MFIIKTYKQFEKDLVLAKKRGRKIDKLWPIVELLQEYRPLSEKCRPHKLVGKWSNFWECHIESDWLLIYRYIDDYLELVRTGTHSDLF